MQREDYERMAKFETQLETMEKLLIEMNAKLDSYSANFVPRNEINEMFKARDEKIIELRENAKSSKAILPAWGAVVVAVVAMIVTLLSNGG